MIPPFPPPPPHWQSIFCSTPFIPCFQLLIPSIAPEHLLLKSSPTPPHPTPKSAFMCLYLSHFSLAAVSFIYQSLLNSLGAMFSSVATVDTFCNFLGAFIFNPMYIQSSKFGFRGLPFLVAAVLIIIPMILTK